MTIDPGFLDKHESSRFTGVSKRALDYARSRGELAYFKFGTKVLFSVDDLEKYMTRFRIDVENSGEGGEE